MAGRTGCGLCGTESLHQVLRDLAPLPADSDGLRFDASAISSAFASFAALQNLQQLTGAVHAAAWCDGHGQVLLLREDVGRHNALDKLIGAMARARVDRLRGFVAVTSRASFEMVQKTASAGVALLAAVSAPTGLAVTTAERLGVTLVGFARQRDLAVYSRTRRISIDQAGAARGR